MQFLGGWQCPWGFEKWDLLWEEVGDSRNGGFSLVLSRRDHSPAILSLLSQYFSLPNFAIICFCWCLVPRNQMSWILFELGMYRWCKNEWSNTFDFFLGEDWKRGGDISKVSSGFAGLRSYNNIFNVLFVTVWRCVQQCLRFGWGAEAGSTSVVKRYVSLERSDQKWSV